MSESTAAPANPRHTAGGISYDVIRSRRSTADIVIERDGSVVVRAPDWADDERIAGIVASRAFWIFRNLAEWRELNSASVVREIKNGESFLYLGRSYRLLLVDDQVEAVQLRGGRFCLRRDLTLVGDSAAAKSALQEWYTARGQDRIGRRVDYFAPKVGVLPASVAVREIGHRWAFCSADRRLAFHWKCMMAPPTILDYVVVHELCHMRERDHTLAFWNEVDKVLPNYLERKEWLRQYGAGLDL